MLIICCKQSSEISEISERFATDKPIIKDNNIKPDHTVQQRLARQKLIRELKEKKAAGEANFQIGRS